MTSHGISNACGGLALRPAVSHRQPSEVQQKFRWDRRRLLLTSPFIPDLRGIPLDPTKNSRVIHIESALTHHLFYVAIRELIATVPSDAQKDERRLEVTPLERGLIFFQGYDSRSVM